MRKFSVRPTLTLRGRKFKGLRGWSGKPTHPPLTDFPIAAYILAAIFDVIAFVGQRRIVGARLLPSRHLRVHRRRGGVGARRADRVLGLVAFHREGNPGPPHRERPRKRDDRRHGARAHRHRPAHQRVRLPDLSHGRDPRDLDRRRPPGLARRGTRRHPRVRLRLQRRDRSRQPGVAPSETDVLPGDHTE